MIAAGAVALAPAPAQADSYVGARSPAVGSSDAGREVSGSGSSQTTSSNPGGASGSLPVTGSDVLQLAVIGLGAVGAGTVLVRTSRRRTEQAS